ncbi:cysteine protease ATG4B-like isoform X2 [Stegodyphus dumicola]|uniref:cysteine protease ATG4B-like isoform X2 n=1 Tax=Stegodyphus dumicola TaxID=202533 RepID=UPI0015B136C1|nr:cysteine protease ATG4B-like isoform X2 [Stegodyphus dumicola]
MELYNYFTSANGETSVELLKKEFKDFPFTLDFVWILGKKYNALHGGTGPKTDKYWGCMLRCGQMIMAEALVCCHLGRGWMWQPGVVDPVYAEILKMFQDKKDCPYSIHQIAQMGVSEGKAVGQWFGPNTVAQVLRKLSVYDEWSSMAVHVAFDNTVIKADIKTLCRHIPEPLTSSPFPKSYQSIWYTDCIEKRCPRWQSVNSATRETSWRPMLLFIPLRLGLSKFNAVYIKNLKNTFMFKQSIGIIGGKPRHAVWFIGYSGDELICLDPHVVQPTVNLDGSEFDDSSFHIPYGESKRMPIATIDPSLSLCFFFESEEDFEDWCLQVQNLLMTEMPLFEVLEDRPEHWPPLELRPDLNCSNCSLEYYFVEPECNSDISEDDFENVEASSCSAIRTNFSH